MKNIRIIIVDDHEMVIQGLVALISANPGFNVVKTYTSGLDAIDELEEVDPDIILMDINMPVINGFETSNRILSMHPTKRIIMLSMEVKKPYMKKALETGIKGFVSKGADISELIQTIKTVYSGGMSFNDYLQIAD
ncbi:MAG: response regulator transcription factor [Ekhidna sp.]|nr:response regulator transcription factor [Ekhidna sp.]